MIKPLVSIIVTNYNYGRFLKRCLDSILNQTYSNIELIICDNGSTDDSLEVVNDYLRKAPTKINFIRHRRNLGASSNATSGENLMQGKYFMNFGADDYLQPSFIDTAVSIFGALPNVSQIITHSDIIDDSDQISKRASFFDGSYIIPGMSYAPLLMVAGVTAHTSQIIYSTDAHYALQRRKGYIVSSMIGERTLAMNHSLNFDLAYLHEPFVVCRESANNETAKMNTDMSQIFEQWSMIDAFAKNAFFHQHEAIFSRRAEAIEKLGELSKRLSAEFYNQGNYSIAGKYLGLSMVLTGAFDNLLHETPRFTERLNALAVDFAKECEMRSACSQIRQHSYPPPAGSTRLDLASIVKHG